jgi:hypothetical protein
VSRGDDAHVDLARVVLAGDQHRHVPWAHPLHEGGQTAVHPGHPQVGDEQIGPEGFEPDEGRGAVRGFVHGAPRVLQRHPERVADAGIVIHDQHARARVERVLPALLSLSERRRHRPGLGRPLGGLDDGLRSEERRGVIGESAEPRRPGRRPST